jgi:hypothetical protein
MPPMSLSVPSHVSATTGSDQKTSSGPRVAPAMATSASRTTPTLWVLVSPTGEVSSPHSRTHSSPVISPFPFNRWQPANAPSRPIRP